MQLIRDNIDLSEYMAEAEVEHAVISASNWVAGVIDHFYKPQEAPKTKLPWIRTHGDFEFRAGEVSLWAGINGHGKSMIVSQVALGLCNQFEKVCVASLEMPPVRTMARMSRQACGAFEPPASFIRKFGAWTDGKLWLYDHVGACKPALMAAVIRYAVDKFKITHFVVDNLMKVVAGEDNYNEQKDFVNTLCSIAHDTGVHIHLVLHIKKLKDEGTVPGKFDIKGSGAITDLVDNVFVVWRNKPKEQSLRESGMEKQDEPDAILSLDKQRNGETEGRYALWFDHSSMQYLESRHDHPKQTTVERLVPVEEVEF